MTQNIESLLAALRAAAGHTSLAASPSGSALEPGVALHSNQEVAELRDKIEQLQSKLEELSARSSAPEPEPAKAPDSRAAPAPPTELALFLQTRLELMERKLELAQQEALRANLLLREREEAQRKAQCEVEEMFRSIREQQRAASYDGALRAQYLAAQQRIRELESRLSLAQVAMIPAEEALAYLQREETQAELKRRLLAQVEESRKRAAQGALSPSPEQSGTAGVQVAASPASAEEIPALAVVLARVADLERRLEEERQAKERERQARLQWENSMIASLGQLERKRGPELLVEATLEDMTALVHKREDAQREMRRLLEALRNESPDSAQAPALRARLEDCRRSVEEIQKKLDQQLSLVQAWVARNKSV